jgi:hypothetical protein
MPVLLIAGSAFAGSAGYAATPTPRLPSAIGDETVVWLTVSPAYAKTGLVMAISVQKHDCIARECVHVWATRDRGANWVRKKAADFEGDRPLIAVDGAGHEAIFSQGRTMLQRSDDYGETWAKAGPNGFPAPVPNSADAAVAVAGTNDYILRGGDIKPVPGSSGAIDDGAFALSPGFPNSGSFAPALLVGADKVTKRPVIQQCKADLSCSGDTSLVGTTSFGRPPGFFFSSNYARDGVVFVKGASVVYKSTDGGISFKPLEVIVDNSAGAVSTTMMAVSPAYREAGPVRTAFVSVTQFFTAPGPVSDRTIKKGGIYKSTDGGKIWRATGSPGPFETGATAVAVAPGGRIFAGYFSGFDGGLLCSAGGEDAWRESCPSGPVVKYLTGAQKAPGYDVVKTVILGIVALSALAVVVMSVRRALRKPAGATYG